MDDDENLLFYDNTCQVVLGRANKSNENYKNVCMKLMKNLGVYSKVARIQRLGSEQCITLNYWLYYVSNKANISAELINKIFQKSNEIVFSDPNQHICFNTYDEKIKDPLKIIKLHNLQENVNIFLSTLKKKGTDDYCSCKKYIYECVDIYKDMNNTYCTDPDDRVNKNKSTCDILSAFKSSYTDFLSNRLDVGEKIPSLFSKEKEHMEECLSAHSSVTGTTNQHSNSHSSTTGGVPTTLATMAGVSSVLALFYKVNHNFHLNN
ncbi:hypothetical protein PVNG_02207 [Plasmodium vivax North Korean]|uniref:Variable surface protein Vir7-like protein n=1 Tax=Plasmodium vivax North Korean TaxID=1035514 RepID=A0A0J9TUU8_PLAVI|nr:hypothetical protein PVNG_02207 [Plasmodium vivax North Korean]